MTIGLGGSTAAIELEKIKNMTLDVKPIQKEEYVDRIKKAVTFMKEIKVKATYVNAGTNLYYFTGTKWNPSERMVGALLYDDGTLDYIVPKFEEGTFKKYMRLNGKINCWEEHESPYALMGELLKNKNIIDEAIAIDESAPYFLVDGLTKTNTTYSFTNALPVTSGCRMQKSFK